MATGSVVPFSPQSTVTVAAGTVAAGGAVPPSDAVLVFNASIAVAFVSFTGEAAAGTPIPAGGSRLFAGAPSIRTASVILESGAGNVYLTTGSGTAY
jgi:hypothetical protein